jgi:hypothetical protein
MRGWLSQFHAFVSANLPRRSSGTLTRQGRRGTTITPLFDDWGSGEGESLQFKGQWVDGTYEIGDIVICKTNPEEDDGHMPGTFIAKAAVTAGDLHPGVVIKAGLATATIVAGEITEITVDDPGEGYSAVPTVTIEGDGDDAAAHAVLSGTVLDSIVVDDGGSGYTEATVTIGSPTMTQKWDPFADRPKEKLTLRPNAQGGDRQQIIIDAGRDEDDGENMPPSIKLIDNKDDLVDSSSVEIDMADLKTIIASLPEGTHLKVSLREWEVCKDGVDRYAVFLSSDAYDHAT